MKTKQIEIPLRARDYCLYGIPYGLSQEERIRADTFLRNKGALSVLSVAGAIWQRYGDNEPMVSITIKVSYPLKNYLADTLAANLSDSRAPKILAWLAEHDVVDTGDYVTLHNGELCAESDAFFCQYNDEYYPDSDNSVTVRVSRGQETWCESAADNNAFQCDYSGDYFCNDAFTCVDVGGDSVCLEWNQDSLYYWESDDSYHDDPEPEEEEENDIPDYHNSPKPWKNTAYRGLVFGCELEMYAINDRADVAEIADNNGLFSERDGSLDSNHGIEVIGRPMTLAEHQAPEGPWLSFLSDVAGKAKGWNAGTGYGLHVSVNRDGMSDYLTGKLLVFIHSNQYLCENIAGRSASQWQRYVKKSVKDGKLKSGEKYEALAIRSASRLECRIFRSTLKPEGFLRGVEFVAAAVEFCRSASAVALTDAAFLAWLKMPENGGAYPNLCLHLGIKKPAVKKLAA